MAANVVVGDCVEQMALMDAESVDAIVCDPPYGLEFMGKEWDKLAKGRAAKYAKGGSIDPENIAERSGKGGAGPVYVQRPAKRCAICGKQAWSGSPCQCSEPRWELDNSPLYAAQEWHYRWAVQALRVLKPGGHLVAFGGSRTYHRMVCAVEDAGFEIRDTLMWLYGQGFPKSLDVSKAIDKMNGKPIERRREFGQYVRMARERAGLSAAEVNRIMGMPQGCGWWEGKGVGGKWDLHMPSRETWLRLKAIVPTLGTEWDWLVDWAEAEREKIGERDLPVGHAFAGPTYGGDSSCHLVDETLPATAEAVRWSGWGTALKPAVEPIVLARKPLQGTVAANVSRFGVGALNIDACRIATEGKKGVWGGTQNTEPGQGGVTMGGGWAHRPTVEHPSGRWPANLLLDDEAAEGLGDAARYFYCAKASSRERNQGLDGLPERLASSMPGRRDPDNAEWDTGNDVTTRFVTAKRNHHPTVKPIALMRWLCRLVTPPDGLILDPFAGSGTTLIAAHLEGFNAVGIELDADYARIAEARLAWWQAQPQQTSL